MLRRTNHGVTGSTRSCRSAAVARGPGRRRAPEAQGRIRRRSEGSRRAIARRDRRDRRGGGRGAARLRREHRLRRAERDAHLGDRRPRAPAEPRPLPLDRRRARPRRPRGARDDAPARAGARARPLAACAPSSSTRSSRCSTRGVHPRIPAQGSVGASGDLAPLAHLALAMIGEGEARDRRAARSSRRARRSRRAGIAPVVLEAKEGLALINGTQYMASLGTLALLEAERLCRAADVAGAMSLEALKGSSRPFDERLQAARPHPGQAVVARNLRALLADSEIVESHQRLRQGAGRLLAPLHAAGARRDARRARLGAPGARARGQQRHRQPERLPRRATARPTSSAAATSTASRSRSRSTSRRWPSPSSRTSASGASSSSSTRRSRPG